MTFNQFMHPKNIYRKKPDFQQLAKEYPEFAVYLDANGKIDFSNINALRSLTETLLKKDFGLNVEIPDGHLVPTLPMRLNYILWIEDILEHCKLRFNITGIDIGTGCCSIFPLLATKLNNWQFIATEIDTENIFYAELNCNQNNLSDRIKIYNNQSDTIFTNVVRDNPSIKFNFIMTNPPFFSDTYNDSLENSSSNFKTFHTSKTNCPSSIEAIYDGGEVNFIKKILEESFHTRASIDIYTVMIGKKKSFLELKYLLKECLERNQISSFNYTELCQGYTKRWAIAWTFNRDISNVPRIKCSKSKPLIHYLNPNLFSCSNNIKSVGNYIKHLLINELNIENFEMIEMSKRIEFDIKSNECTWRNQRRKRRQQKMKDLMEKNDNSELNITKRQLDEDQSSGKNAVKKHKENDGLCKKDLTYLLHCELIVKRDKQDILIKMTTKEMSQNCQSTMELFQFFKNKLV